MFINRPASQKGVVILEALIASAIFIVGLVALSQYQSVIQRESGENKAHDAAALLAQEKLDEFRQVTDKTSFEALATGSDSPIELVNTSFTRSWTITNDASVATDKYIVITVSWTSADGTAESVGLTGFVRWSDVSRQAIYLSGGTSIPSSSGGTLNPDKEYTPTEFEELKLEEVEDEEGNPQKRLIQISEDISVYENEEGQAEVIVKKTDGETVVYDVVFISYNSGVVMLRGIVTVGEGARTAADFFLSDPPGEVLTTDTGYCVHPEESGHDVRTPFGDGDISTSETEILEGNQDRFHCFTGRTWYGNMGMFGYDKKDLICPPLYTYPPTIGVHDSLQEVSSIIYVDDESVEHTTSVPQDRVWALDDQNFRILSFKDSCEETGSGTVDLTFALSTYPGATLVTDLGDTTVEAVNPIGECDPLPATTEDDPVGSCSVDIGGGGYTGRVVLVPDNSLRICGSNVIDPDPNPSTSTLIGAFQLALASEEPTGCVSKYEHLINITVTDAQTAKKKDQLDIDWDAVEISEETYDTSCLHLSTAASGKSAVYSCGVVAEFGETLNITATFDTLSDSDTVDSFTSLSVAKGSSWELPDMELGLDL
ncbi:hypothetical protein BOW34_04615 [Solemya velum gill symbiont]|uniref:type IV pilus modification PilV family protein n=1 Tax=Solemya velum gill symbiont TaxID=2340 RepID=UPI000997864C|nr:hypothetical protein [Solemya velum gill symbiont]OOZ25069.1 hypothetical protein BOW31_03410 [Solemya velum gill symbiont]OOZ27375.1 hypothetical protein BOW32_04540 [Solemya velum gill symbiont]OOZ32167.1 hypothetical protein BOW34_04615 [Solemya velum gill symbiont]